jgi:hypothetical protein
VVLHRWLGCTADVRRLASHERDHSGLVPRLLVLPRCRTVRTATASPFEEGPGAYATASETDAVRELIVNAQGQTTAATGALPRSALAARFVVRQRPEWSRHSIGPLEACSMRACRVRARLAVRVLRHACAAEAVGPQDDQSSASPTG